MEQKEVDKIDHSIESSFDTKYHVFSCLNCEYELTEKHNMDASTNKCENCDFEVIVSPQFETGYITTKYTEIETEHFICKLDAHTYVIGDLEDCLESLYDALQVVSGLKFNTKKLGKITIEVKTIEPDEDGYVSETHVAYAWSNGVCISTGDLFVSGGYCIAHELSHVLQNHNSGWYFGQTLTEGFAEYNTYKTIKYLEKKNPQLAYYLNLAEKTIHNMWISSDSGYEHLYSQPLSYWYENEFTYAGNVNYTIGFRLMRYLDDVYGEYSSWITEYEKKNPQYVHDSNILELSEIVQILPDTYGEDVEDNFYPWLKENRSFFDITYPSVVTDRRKLEYTNIYPNYWAWYESTVFTGFKYKDVYINIDELRKYITEYKGDELHDFRFTCITSEPATIKLYDSNGNLISKQSATSKEITCLLDGVGFIQFVGEGTITSFEVFK